jgi:hypothetical protein
VGIRHWAFAFLTDKRNSPRKKMIKIKLVFFMQGWFWFIRKLFMY